MTFRTLACSMGFGSLHDVGDDVRLRVGVVAHRLPTLGPPARASRPRSGPGRRRWCAASRGTRAGRSARRCLLARRGHARHGRGVRNIRCPGSITRNTYPRRGQLRDERRVVVGIVDTDRDVDDRLRRQTGHRRRTDVLDAARHRTERIRRSRRRSYSNRAGHDAVVVHDPHVSRVGPAEHRQTRPPVPAGDPSRRRPA